MKKTILVALAAFVSFGAEAADLPRPPVTTPIVPIVPVFSWTGVYVGFNAGYSWG